jgi:excisionase family DNA binding protein
MKNHLTVTETAKRLKLTRQAVLYAIKAGKLPAERAGRQWMVHTANIDRAYFVNLWDSQGKLIRDPALPAYDEGDSNYAIRPNFEFSRIRIVEKTPIF